MILEVLKLKLPLKDSEFDSIYPAAIKKLSERHFTPFAVGKKISDWLNEYEEPLKVIDLGCGVGKFCFVVSSFTKHSVTGIDFRKNYIDLCNKINSKYKFKNLHFINKNITELDFKEYNVFYFFNSFLEQVDDTAVLDNHYERSHLIYNLYEMHLKNAFLKMPLNTIVITYHVFSDQVPFSYELVKQDFEGALKMWVKK